MRGQHFEREIGAGFLGCRDIVERFLELQAVQALRPVAEQLASDLGDAAATIDLLALLDAYMPGQLAPMMRAERDLCRARLATGQAATAVFAAAISRLREQSTPYHLAHGLLDQALYLDRLDDSDAAAAAIEEARDIASRLRCQPLLDRAADMTAPDLRIQA